MKCRETTVKLLYRIRKKNLKNQKNCEHIANHAKNLLLKSFFRKLARQKQSFDFKIKKEIEVLEREILLMGGVIPGASEAKDSNEPALPLFRFEKYELLRECYRKEKKTLKRCDKLLSQISSGRVREMLLGQKYELNLILREIKCMGIKIYENSDDEIAY